MDVNPQGPENSTSLDGVTLLLILLGTPLRQPWDRAAYNPTVAPRDANERNSTRLTKLRTSGVTARQGAHGDLGQSMAIFDGKASVMSPSDMVKLTSPTPNYIRRIG